MNIPSLSKRTDKELKLLFIQILSCVYGVQALGANIYIYANGSAIGKILWLNLGLDDQLAYGLDKVFAFLAMALSVYAIIFKKSWPCFLCAAWFLSLSLGKLYNGGSFSAPYSLFAHAVRYASPLALGVYFKQAQIAGFSYFDFVKKILLISTTSVFAAHGVEALFHNPIFIDYIIRFSRVYAQIKISEDLAKNLLYIIGVQDILLAIAILFPRRRWPLAYMAFWGFWTASLRTFFSPQYGLGDTLIRATNGGVPLALFILTHLHEASSFTGNSTNQSKGGELEAPS